MLRCIQLQQQHDEDAVVGQLLELCLPHIMVLDQHPDHDTQHLDQEEERVSSWRTDLLRLHQQLSICCTLLRRLILVTVLVASPECLTSRAISLTKASRLW